ncbi:hypothetical protein O3P69_008333 [Scylla paramamosain]|uniref:Uncharacterized protein n=1 Tax=Scylla paramamosain TaxID=85552 RepID=A0AAW0SKJ0_SCYPA
MNTILDYPLHFPGSNTTLPWAQTGMSLAVVLVALMVLVLSCCGAAALFLAACCGNRRRDTVAESGDSRWLPGIGLIDYVPVSNRSSVRVSLVLSDSMQDLEGGADESHTPAISASHVSQQSPSRPQLYRAGAAASTQHLYTAAVSPEKDVRVSHSAEASPPRFVSQASVNSSEYNKDQELIEGDFKAALETAQQPINLISEFLNLKLSRTLVNRLRVCLSVYPGEALLGSMRSRFVIMLKSNRPQKAREKVTHSGSVPEEPLALSIRRRAMRLKPDFGGAHYCRRTRKHCCVFDISILYTSDE